jgi:ribosome-associated protein
MISICDGIALNDNELQFDFVRSSGPGGQNVNKVATAVQLRFDVRNSPSLSAEVKERLGKLAGSRMSIEGILVIEAKRHRTQEGNREDAIGRLSVLIERACQPPKPRRKTRPSTASRMERLDGKKRRSQVKQSRGRLGGGEE